MSKTLMNQPLVIKNLTIPNRIVLPPMCMNMVEQKNGIATEWHTIHYASRAVGGTGLIIVEATGISPDGRITHEDLGLWNNEQATALANVVKACQENGAAVAVQLNHAGRKARDAKRPVAASAVPYVVGDTAITPQALSEKEIEEIISQFQSATRRAVAAGFDAVELHGAHGYLVHQFHSPLLNTRTDRYGKDITLFGREVIQAMRKEMPKDMPLILRLSAIEYMDGGYDIEHGLAVAKDYLAQGVDILDISSGGEGTPGKRKPGNYPGYQLEFARAFKDAFAVPVIAVGMLEHAPLAAYALASGATDFVAVGRGMLGDPYWATRAQKKMGLPDIAVPSAYSDGV